MARQFRTKTNARKDAFLIMKVILNKKKTNKKLVLFVSLVLILVIIGGIFINFSSDNNFISDQFGPFSTKSFPIVVDESPIAKSKFQLSEKIIIDEAFSQNGSVPIRLYEQNYGTYPIITTELDANRLCTAFAMSILDMNFETASKFTEDNKTVMPYLVKYNLGRQFTSGVELDSDGKLCQTKIKCDNKSADISIVSSGLLELMLLSKETNTDIVYNIFASDALVVFTSSDNPIDSITKEELKKIYQGEIKNWKKVSGENKKIKKYERSLYSAAQTAFEAYVLDELINEKNWNEILNTANHSDDREEYINSSVAIGYALKSQFDLTYAKDENIKILKMDNIFPTEENILNGSYPLSVPYYYVYKLSDDLLAGGQFADWIQTDEGEKCIRAVGLIPVFNEKEYIILEGKKEKRIN